MGSAENVRGTKPYSGCHLYPYPRGAGGLALLHIRTEGRGHRAHRFRRQEAGLGEGPLLSRLEGCAEHVARPLACGADGMWGRGAKVASGQQARDAAARARLEAVLDGPRVQQACEWDRRGEDGSMRRLLARPRRGLPGLRRR